MKSREPNSSSVQACKKPTIEEFRNSRFPKTKNPEFEMSGSTKEGGKAKKKEEVPGKRMRKSKNKVWKSTQNGLRKSG